MPQFLKDPDYFAVFGVPMGGRWAVDGCQAEVADRCQEEVDDRRRKRQTGVRTSG